MFSQQMFSQAGSIHNWLQDDCTMVIRALTDGPLRDRLRSDGNDASCGARIEIDAKRGPMKLLAVNNRWIKIYQDINRVLWCRVGIVVLDLYVM